MSSGALQIKGTYTTLLKTLFKSDYIQRKITEANNEKESNTTKIENVWARQDLRVISVGFGLIGLWVWWRLGYGHIV